MAKTKTITTYRIDELSGTAKETALNWYRDCICDDDIDDVKYYIKYCASILGIDIENIWYSHTYSQGDGACFEGTYYYKKGWKKDLKEYVAGDDLKKLLNIGLDLQEAQRQHFYGISANVLHRGNHYHSGCSFVDYESEHRYDVGIELEEKLTEAMRSFMDWMFDYIKREYDYLCSESNVMECCKINEYDFDENGYCV